MTAIQSISRLKSGSIMRPATLCTVADVLNKTTSFFLLFYFASTLTGSDFGVLSLFSNSIFLIMPLASLGMLQPASMQAYKSNKNTFSVFFSSVITASMLLALMLMTLLFVVHGPLHLYFSLTATFVLLMPLTAFFNFLNEQLVLFNRSSPVKYFFIIAGKLLSQVTLAVFFTGAMEWGWKGAAAATFVSCFILAMYAFYYCKEEGLLVNSISKKILLKAIKDNMPLAAMKAGLFCTAASSVYFIAYFTGDMAQVAVFGITASVASIILLLCNFMFKYSYPKMQVLLNAKLVNYAAVRWHFILYAGIMMLGCVVAVIIIPVVYDMLPGQTYQAGLFYYMFICMGYFFGALAFMMQSLLLFKMQTKTLFLLSAISIITTVLLSMLFTKLWGTFGAAVAIYAANCINLLITILAAKKYLAAIFSSNPSKTSKL